MLALLSAPAGCDCRCHNVALGDAFDARQRRPYLIPYDLDHDAAADEGRVVAADDTDAAAVDAAIACEDCRAAHTTVFAKTLPRVRPKCEPDCRWCRMA